MRKLSIVLVALVAVVWLSVLVHRTVSGFARPAAHPARSGPGGGLAALPAAEEPDAAVYAATLRPPLLHRGGGDDQVFVTQGIVPPGAAEKRTFVLPAMQRVTALLLGEGVRYTFRAPSGATFVPGKTPNGSGFESSGESPQAPGFSGFTLDHPEAGTWTVTVEAKGLGVPKPFAIDMSADRPDENAGLEMMTRDSDPAFTFAAKPGDPVFIRAFVTRGGGPVSGVRWDILAETPDNHRVRVSTYDDGRHADGAVNDGVSVGAIVAHGPDGYYQVVAAGHVPGGVTHTVTGFFEVEAKNDLLIADSITVEPPSPKVGEPVTLTVTCMNDGTVDTHGVELELWLGERKFSSQKFDLKAGESRRVATSWTPTTPGAQEVSLGISPWIEPSGSDFANNTRKKVVTVR